MPGLYAVRPLASGSKAAKAAPSKVASAPRLEKQREDRSSQFVPRFRRLPAAQVASAFRPSQNLTSADPIRLKQVTDPLTETVRARIYGAGINAESIGENYGSSGSNHEPTSVCLAAMVHEFIEEEVQVGSCGRARCNCLNGTCSGEGCLANDTDDTSSLGQSCEILEGVTSCTSTGELILLAEVAKAVEAVQEQAHSICQKEGVKCTSGCLRRSVMKHLRLVGYNAAVCKSRWDHTGAFPAGDYEYIDVIVDGKSNKTDRFIVDTDFKAQFEIARASNQYNSLLQVVPCIFVGRPERLKQIIKIMSDAAKRSLRKKGLHLPPWRKQWYLQAKWFSAYKRTTNEDAPCHQNPDEILSQEFSSIALKGSRFDSRFANEMETFYMGKARRQDSNLQDSSLQGSSKAGDGRGNMDGGRVGEGMAVDDDGVVRERGRGGRLREVGEITGMSSQWQLPTVNPRREEKMEVVSGLATALHEAGLCTLSRIQQRGTDERQQEQKLLQPTLV